MTRTIIISELSSDEDTFTPILNVDYHQDGSFHRFRGKISAENVQDLNAGTLTLDEIIEGTRYRFDDVSYELDESEINKMVDYFYNNFDKLGENIHYEPARKLLLSYKREIKLNDLGI